MDSAGVFGSPRAWTRGLLRCGVAAGPVFVAVFVLEGAVRDGYRPLRHPVSSLALGTRGWIQAGNFAVAGTLFVAGAAGLARAGGPGAGSRAVPARFGGLFQRASIITGFAWLTALSARALQHVPATGGAKPAATTGPAFPGARTRT